MAELEAATHDKQKTKLRQTQKEVDRLVRNWRMLLDVMPEMVLLVREDYVIEYMNDSAIDFFGDIRHQYCYKGFHGLDHPCNDECPVKATLRDDSRIGTLQSWVGDRFVEYSYASFEGYLGDRLILFDMHDLTRKKQYETEIAQFNENIETILQRKITELKENEKVMEQLSHEVDVLKGQLQLLTTADEMVGGSKPLRKVRDLITQVADSHATILITGESGTGKELAANLIRNLSDRSDKPFLKVNCNTINDNLLESDLFGYEKGAFTGADSRKKGKFEIVDNGTIFLDEIGEISPRMQAALLRVLQNGEIIPVGGTKAINMNVRIIAATNIDLEKAVKDGRFRLDLYYRLNIINVTMPPLRERKDDIVDLATHFVKHYRKAFKKEIDFMPNSVIDKLLTHDWPGNVRELENVIQRAVLMGRNNTITVNDIHLDQNMNGGRRDGVFSSFEDRVAREPLKRLLGDIEGVIIKNTLERQKGNVQGAAKILKIGKTALYEKMKRHGLLKKQIKK